MVVYVNGSEEHWIESQTLAAWLKSQGLLGRRIAVELNGKIIPKSRLAEVQVKERDTLEIIAAIGGG